MSSLSQKTRLPVLPPPEAEAPRPRPHRAGPFGVLDIGSTKVTCLIGRSEGDGSLRVLGCGWQRSRGVRSGGIYDLDEAERAIRAAVAQAEEHADHRLRSVVVNLACGQPESRLFGLQWPVGGRQVTEADIRRVAAEARTRAAMEGRETIHALPLGFAVDEVGGVADPRGHHCDVLTARLHVIDATSSSLRNLGLAVARCDLDIAELVSAPFAAGLAALVEDERELGATVIDMGGGTTGIGIFGEGQLLHTAMLPIGGQHVTKDIATVLSTPLAHAERLKTVYGSVHIAADDERELLPVPKIGEEDHHFAKIPRSMIGEVIRPRLEETFELVRDQLDGAGLGRVAGTRVVLTGGASQMQGVREMAAGMLGREVRLGRPGLLRGLPDSAAGPGFATTAGLLAWAAGDGRAFADLDLADARPAGMMRRVVDFLRDRF